MHEKWLEMVRLEGGRNGEIVLYERGNDRGKMCVKEHITTSVLTMM